MAAIMIIMHIIVNFDIFLQLSQI